MKILFICSGNTCRSPLAEAFFRDMTGDEHQVRSAGVTASNGDPASSHVVRILEERGISIHHQSQRVNWELMDWADLVLTMTQGNYYLLLANFPEMREKFHCLKEFLGEKDDLDVLDPFGKDLDAYGKCAKDIEKYLSKLVKKVESLKN